MKAVRLRSRLGDRLTGSDGRGPGRFLVFEGLDGAGTTTQLRSLAQVLSRAGLQVELTHEPTNGPIGSALRQAIEGRTSLDAPSMALAFAADRSDHLYNTFNGVCKALERGVWVLCDRYVLSSLAYQAGNSVTVSWLKQINDFAIDPDVTILVDTTPQVCMERLNARSVHQELNHDLSRLINVRARYREFAVDGATGVGNLIRVDGDGPVEVVHEQIMQKLDAPMRQWRTNAHRRAPWVAESGTAQV